MFRTMAEWTGLEPEQNLQGQVRDLLGSPFEHRLIG